MKGVFATSNKYTLPSVDCTIAQHLHLLTAILQLVALATSVTSKLPPASCWQQLVYPSQVLVAQLCTIYMCAIDIDIHR